MSQLECLMPKSVEEAISLLTEYGEQAEIMAGGTDSLLKMKEGDALPNFFINISNLQELDYIRHDAINGLRIGAGTPVCSIVNSSIIMERFGIVSHAAGTLGTPTIRRQATIGGNLCNASPSADLAPALLVLGAQLKIADKDGQKNMAVESFFRGPGQTSLLRGEILTEIRIPNQLPNSKSIYLKQTRSRGADLAITGVAVLVVMDGAVIQEAKIALCAVAPTPFRAQKAEDILQGKKPDDSLLEACAEAALQESRPIDDVRSSASYRKKLIKVLLKRALKKVTELEL